MRTLRITVVNHAQIEIACPPERVWRMISEDLGKGRGFASQGYRIDPLATPAPYLGAYRMFLETPDLVDNRFCGVTERDEAAMRMSLYAEFLSAVANKMVTYATYQAIPTEIGCLYRLDCHSTLDHAVEDDASRDEIARSVTALQAKFDQGLATGFVKHKALLEGVEG
jgi:hypothetical protein